MGGGLEDELECPVCKTFCRPDKIGTYGLCLKNCHLICEYCATKIIQTAGPKCPLCRCEPFEIRSNYTLADKVLKQLVQETIYNCEFCDES